MPEVQQKLANHVEVAANLDQNPQVQLHFGSEMPTLLASMSNIYALLRDRLFTGKVTWLKHASRATPAMARCLDSALGSRGF